MEQHVSKSARKRPQIVDQTKSIWIIGAVVTLTLVIIGVGVYWRQGSVVEKSQRETPEKSWQNRFIYDAFNYMYPGEESPKMDLRSINSDGTNERKHALICDGENVHPLGNITRSTEGKIIAFLLPTRQQRSQNPNWQKELSEGKKLFVQGTIYLFNLENNSCQTLGVTADNLYSQSLAFSPDGKYLAYVFYGLHVYNLETAEDRTYTLREGSANSPSIITGPLQWNTNSSAIYMAVSNSSVSSIDDPYPTYLAKVDITKTVDLKKINLSDDPNLGPAERSLLLINQTLENEQKVTDLPDFYIEFFEKGFLSSGKYPDRFDVYAVSPEGRSVAYLQEKNLVIKDAKKDEEEVLWQRPDAFEEYTNRIVKIVWAQNGWLFFETSQEAPGSGVGNIWGSFNRRPPEKLVHGERFSTNSKGSRIAYNFDYFGEYYILPGQLQPEGFEPTGHQYNGIGVYEVVSKEEIKISGREKTHGYILAWFR